MGVICSALRSRIDNHRVEVGLMGIKATNLASDHGYVLCFKVMRNMIQYGARL